MFRRLVLAAGIATAAVALLTGCPGPVPSPTPTGSGSATPGPTPTPTPTGLGADVAFVVTGELQSHDDLNRLSFRMTVGYPLAGDPTGAAAFASSTHCPPDVLVDTPPTIASPAYVPVHIETGLLTGDVSATDVLVITPGLASTWSGDYQTYQASCSDPLLKPVPGTAEGYLLAEAGVDTGTGGWIATGLSYGVTAAIIDPATMSGDLYSVEECDIRFGPAATAPVTTMSRTDSSVCSFSVP